MKKLILAIPLLAASLVLLVAETKTPSAKPVKVLIVDGQNNHQWAATTPLLERMLENTGRFTVDVATSPPEMEKPPRMPKEATPAQKEAHQAALKAYVAGEAARKAKAAPLWAQWRPKFADYDVVLSNYNGEDWPEEVRKDLIAFVSKGGGLVSYHAANNAFAQWPEYNRMIGVGGWGGRKEASGPWLRFRDGKWTTVQQPGPGGGHGPQHEFTVETYAPEHPVMKGLPAKWTHAKDELYHQLRGPAQQVTVLAGAMSDQTKELEPMLMAIPFGQGRVFHTTLGHSTETLQGLGFQVTLARGTEWAATGAVTLQAPAAGELSDGPSAALRPLTATAVK
jgi:type 1 glutamine amidotransferase